MCRFPKLVLCVAKGLGVAFLKDLLTNCVE